MLQVNHNVETELTTDEEVLAIPVQIQATALAAGQPVTFGVPLPKGRVVAPAAATLASADDVCVPVQAEPLLFWSDGSVQWLLVDTKLPRNARDRSWELEVGRRVPDNTSRTACESHESSIVLFETPQAVVLGTGAARFEISRQEFRIAADSAVAGIHLTDKKGRRHVPVLDQVQVETRGPIRTTIALFGQFRRLGLRVRVRLSFYAGTGLVKVDTTLHNPRRARHRGGLWDLGDTGSALFEDFSFEVVLRGERTLDVAYRADDEKRESLRSLPIFSLYQDSSGGENWTSRNHLNGSGRVPVRFRGYRLRAGDIESTGLRASPTVSVRGSAGSVTAAVPEFWQQFPKAITVEGSRMRVGLFPGEFDDLYELQGGERKTHSIWLRYDAADVSDDRTAALDWVHQPAVIQPTAEWCDHSGALPQLCVPPSEATERLDALLKKTLEGNASLLANRERVDEYGWRSYGDIFADHEQTYYEGQHPLISHYNNQFDMIDGFLLHGLRSEDRRWLDLCNTLVRHVVDIDIYHTTQDKAAYNGGLFWFTDHCLHAEASTHRTYSAVNRPNNAPYGGGPGAEHNFTTGLLHHYCLTGNRDARDAVIGLAEWVIAMDDGHATIFGIVDDGPTGLASATGSRNYHGPGRAAGNSINALLDAWMLTRLQRYLAYAELLIRRCIHPEDDVDGRDLLNVEKRWSYTVFLTALAKYVDQKIELKELDSMHAYAQASLLTYARWMLEHEQPYFDQTEKLEYPTEAWAAQEFRKANVLRLAARHAQEPLRTRLFARGTELADRAWADLWRFETRNYARAVAIVMVEGLKDCAFRSGQLAEALNAEFDGEFGQPQIFVPQRQRISRKLKSASGALAIAVRLVNPQCWTRFLKNRYGTTRDKI